MVGDCSGDGSTAEVLSANPGSGVLDAGPPSWSYWVGKVVLGKHCWEVSSHHTSSFRAQLGLS